MSAAEPAIPPTPPMNTGESAAVIDLNHKRPRGKALTAAQGRWNTVNTPADHPPRLPQADSSGEDVLGALAGDAETFFNQIKRTLSDDETARIYTHTIGFVGRILDGAVAQQMITQEQRDELAVLLVGLAAAPNHL